MSQNKRDKKRKLSIVYLDICKGLKLWPHQEEALQLVKRYFGNYDKNDPRTMLVQMPAAAGKTAAAAVISHCFSDLAVILVIVPPGCRKKMAHREICEIFWKNMPMERPPEKKIILVDKKDIDTYKNDLEGNTVFLCTMSQFCDIAGENRYREFFNALKNHLSAVILNTGNLLLSKERTVISDIIKLRKPTVLLKETLFRDDFLRFNVDPGYTFCLTSGEKALFAPLKFENTGTPGDINRFIEAVLETLKKEFNDNRFPADFRLQVHCESADDIETMTTALNDKRINAVGVHPVFKKEKRKPPLYPDIRSTEEVKANVWVLSHHHIEEHHLKYHSMALYSPLHDNEVLTRQLSRISRKGCQTGHIEWSHVFFTDENDVEEFWERYRTYEDGINSAVGELVREMGRELEQGKTANDGIELFKISLKKKELDIDLRGGTLKKKFDIYEPEAYKKINLRYSGIIFPFTKDIKVTVKKEYEEEKVPLSIDLLKEKILDEWENQLHRQCAPPVLAAFDDEEYAGEKKPGEETWVFLYIDERESSLLKPGYYFPEPVLGVTVIHKAEPYLFYFDSGNKIPEVLAELPKVGPNYKQVKHLAGGGGIKKITMAGLLGSNLGLASFRASTSSAFNLDKTIHGVADHTYICARVIGQSGFPSPNPCRRDIGLLKRKVTETSSKRSELLDCIKWYNNISKELTTSPTVSTPLPSLNFLRRFAQPCEPPSASEGSAQNILLDLYDLEDKFADKNGTPLLTESIAAEVVKDEFEYEINGKLYPFGIKYEFEKKRYRLTQKDLNKEFREKNRGVLSYLNQQQAFRVIPRTDEPMIYMHGDFFRPIICTDKTPKNDDLFDDYSAINQIDLCRILHPEKALDGVHSEKGKNCKSSGAGWEDGCLFDLIDNAPGNGVFGGRLKDIEVLICDDMGLEIADFIAADNTNGGEKEGRVIFIHAKAFSEPVEFGAAKLAEVCGQVQKNLHFVDRFSTTKPPKLKKWEDIWTAPGINGYVEKKIRRSNSSEPNTLWTSIKETLRNPLAQIEVWIVLGNGHRKESLETLLSQPRRSRGSSYYGAIQSLYQLESTWSLVASMGATLRVFCR